jgi:ferrochelatase
MPKDCDALLVVSFGGPDGPEDVVPFLENVLRGRNVPRERMLEVAEHYYKFGGRSPINDQNRALIAALENELSTHGPRLPIYWGNRNWHPLLTDTVRQMAADGVERALAFVTSAYSSYSSCRQYLENIAAARQQLMVEGKQPPQIDKLRAFFNHSGFIEPMIEHTRAALARIPVERREAATHVFTAHSIPQAMADSCRYEEQLREACRLVAEGAGRGGAGFAESSGDLRSGSRAGSVDPRTADAWHLVYQSRSGPPKQPWLEPDIGDFLKGCRVLGVGCQDVVVVPIGFISDHLEVLYDLDVEAKRVCDELGIKMVRAATVGTHPRFVRMIRELIEERMSDSPNRLALGNIGPDHDVCPDDCCVCIPNRPSG